MNLEPQILRSACAWFGFYVAKSGETLNSPSQEKQRFILQLLKNVYPFVLLLLNLTVFVSSIVHVSFINDFLVSWLVATLVYGSAVLAHLAIILEAQAKALDHDKFLCKLYNTAVMLKLRLKRAHFYSQRFPRKLKRIFVGIGLSSIIFIVIFAVVLTVLQDAGYFWLSLPSILTMRLRFMQLLIYMHILRKLIKALNGKLRQVVVVTTSHELHFADMDIQQLDSYECLLAIKDMYTDIHECFALYNTIAGWSLFAIVSCYFLDFTCHTYWLFLAMDNLLPRLYVLATLSTLIPLCTLFCWFCQISQECKTEGHLTAALVQKLTENRAKKFSRPYRCLSHHFSLQLQQQQIRISAKGFYEFDKMLIMSIFAALATHLVILIQFLKDDQYTENIFTK